MAGHEHNERLWDIEDVARFLRVSDRTVRRRMEEDGLPHRWIGGKLRFIASEVRAWVLDQPGKAPTADEGGVTEEAA
ncbi:MAG TPA: helix-turn-helix domain-containing protein [Longimicrobiales bacterium]|nr:helix-turn-helix domain-containing protein [Longimicrobiales bacterium]